MAIYVDISATGTDNSKSWPNAFKDFREALESAPSDSTIRIGRGTYYLFTTDLMVSFVIKNGVKFYGAYLCCCLLSGRQVD